MDVARTFQVTRIKVECCRDERFVKARTLNPKNFFAELKRRNVYKVAIAYGVVAWLLMQVATQVFPFLVRHALVCEQFVIRDRHRLPLDNETTDR